MKNLVTTSISFILLVSLMLTQVSAQFVMGNQFAKNKSAAFNPTVKMTVSAAETLPQEEYRAKYLDPAEGELKELEKLIDDVTERRMMTDEEGEQIGEISSKYAETMYSAYIKATEQATAASETGGEQGNADLVGDFEAVAVDHEKRTEVIAEKTTLLFEEVKEYSVKLDRQTLEKLSATQLKEFEDFLTPKGRVKLRKENPDLFKTATDKRAGRTNNQSSGLKPISFQSAENQLTTPVATCSNQEEPAGFTNFLATNNTVGAFSFSSAPQLVMLCVRPCREKNWEGCLTCVSAAIAGGVAAYNEYQSCKNNVGPCKWYKPWNCIRRAICLAKFIAKLA